MYEIRRIKKSYNLSLLRFIALVGVILCHYFEAIKWNILGNTLSVGVQIFYGI
jgi:peptidoglycan/LPS O-acetylase OafA/YrhL